MTGPQAARLRIEALRSTLAGPFSMTLPPGVCAVITGASGSGKSLFLRMIADLDPCTGQVWLDGRERSGFSPSEWRRRVVYCPAESGWWRDDVAAHFPDDRRSTARALAPELGLDSTLFDGSVLRLSTGERQRFALLRALTLNPPVLLLDEPTGALDEGSTAKVETLLKARLDAGVTMIVVTHDEDQAQRLGTNRFQMANRHLIPA